MKNREKFREEIIRSLSGANKDNFDCGICDFVQKHVFPYFGDIHNVEYKCNAELDCDICGIMFSFWLDEEYEEPPKPEVDWSKVPVDTLVRVRNRVSEDWRLMYFKELRTDYVYNRHITWKDGKTSKTAEGDCVGWQYCELVEDEDDGSN